MGKKANEENPMFTKKGAWLWLLCAPLAVVLYACYETKIYDRKRRAKEAQREAELRRKYPEFDWWLDDQGF